jgi:SET domain-containing protein
LINDGCGEEANSKMKRVIIKNYFHLCLFATRDLEVGEQILYDYGDEEKHLWWRRKVNTEWFISRI